MTKQHPRTPDADRLVAADRLKDVTMRLWTYCRERNWAGYDPYDALNSRVYRALPFLHFRLARLVLIQTLKRCPFNLRPMLLVPPTQNPKGIALFLSAALKLKQGGMLHNMEDIRTLRDLLVRNKTEYHSHVGWGYNFDWQTRTEMVPAGTPNIICTTFAGNALLDLYEAEHDDRLLDMARQAAAFLLDVLYSDNSDGSACFNYTPLWEDRIHNANLLGAAFLARVARLSGESRFAEAALRAARFSVSRQHADGSWPYGERQAPSQAWVDNFHTGFNLCALRKLGRHLDTKEFDPALSRGFDFFVGNFFLENGTPKYYHDRVHPIDIHSAAQSIITLCEFAGRDGDNLEQACRILEWTLQNLYDMRGFFYYQKRPLLLVKISYMRWSQAWMLLALSTLEGKLAAASGSHTPE